MATSLVPAATTLLLLLLLTPATADTDGDLVLDVEGNPLEVGSEYYIHRAVGFFGGIGRNGRDSTDQTCPLYVVERLSEVNRGEPVKFVPVNETQKEIRLSSDVQIDSGWSHFCKSEGFWRVTFDFYNRGDVIIATEDSGVPRASFRIEKTEGGSLNAYKIAYSPPATTSSVQQRYLTVFQDVISYFNFVGLTDDPARIDLFVFYKNKKDIVASI